MPGAIIAGGAIAAGGALGAAAIQSHAAGQASQQQTQSNQQALALAQQIYQQNQGNLRPYMAAGGAASSTLQQLMGLPGATGNLGPNGFLPPGATATGPGYTYNPSTGGVTITDLGTSVLNPAAAGLGQQALNRYRPGGSIATTGGPSGLGPAGAGITIMRAPDGTVRQVPANQVNQALANGGQIIA